MEDCDAYVEYPNHRKWFNKLWLSEELGYKCGPAGTDIPEDGMYVVRPIYNLGGMGVGATVQKLLKDDYTSVPPGYFWCEYFDGPHYSTNYKFITANNPYWESLSCFEGTNYPINLTKFAEWKRVDKGPDLPRVFNELSDVGIINVECIGDKPIEVHLRESPDPEYDHIIPVWKSDEGKTSHYLMHGYKYIEAFDNSNKQLDDPRLGFLVK